MNQSTIQGILLVAGITVLAVGMLTGFAGSAAAEQTNVQASEQSQEGAAVAAAEQGISVDTADLAVGQTNVQASSQNAEVKGFGVSEQTQEAAAVAAAAQDISIDVSDAAEQGISVN